MTDLLRHRLEQAADDRHRPLETDIADLVVRARAARDRRRRTTIAAVLVTATAVLGTSLGISAALPAGDGDPAPGAPTGSAAPSSPGAATPVPPAQVVARCRPQLAKYGDYPMYAVGPRVDWRLSHPDRSYTPGDVVALQDRRGFGNHVLCLLPEAGHAGDPVPFTAFEPDADDTDRIREVCSETLVPDPTFDPESGEVSAGTGTTPDLRDAKVGAATRTGSVTGALLTLDGRSWSCFIAPLTWDAGISSVSPGGRGLRNVYADGSTTGGSNKSIVDETASWYYGGGTLPRDAATVEYVVQGRAPVRVPVHDGHYVFVVREPGAGGLQATHYRVLDGQDRVLYEQQGWD